MPSRCYALVILFHFYELFRKKNMSILCLIKYIKPKYEIIYSDQISYEIPKSSKTKVKFEISTLEIGYRENFVKIIKLILVDKVDKVDSCRFGSFCNFLGCSGSFRVVSAGFVLLWLVSARFGSFRVLVSIFLFAMIHFESLLFIKF